MAEYDDVEKDDFLKPTRARCSRECKNKNRNNVATGHIIRAISRHQPVCTVDISRYGIVARRRFSLFSVMSNDRPARWYSSRDWPRERARRNIGSGRFAAEPVSCGFYTALFYKPIVPLRHREHADANANANDKRDFTVAANSPFKIFVSRLVAFIISRAGL